MRSSEWQQAWEVRTYQTDSITKSNDYFVGFDWPARLYCLRFAFVYSID